MRHPLATTAADRHLGSIEAFQRWREATDNFLLVAWAMPWDTGRTRRLQAAAEEIQRLYFAWCRSLFASTGLPAPMLPFAGWPRLLPQRRHG